MLSIFNRQLMAPSFWSKPETSTSGTITFINISLIFAPNLRAPRTHKICDIKNFFGIKFGDFVKIWNLANFVKFEILNPSENQNLRSLTLDHKIWILTSAKFLFDEFWWILMKILTKIENLRSLTLKSKIWRNHKIWNP